MNELRKTLNENEIKKIEECIGYTFNNKKLLITAFTRKSFTEEHDKSFSNETFEYIGDTVIDLVVNKRSFETIVEITNDEVELYKPIAGLKFMNKSIEEILTSIKQSIVCTSNLAFSLDELRINEDLMNYLIVSQADINNDIYNNEKIKADLFESIVGAITIDSNWNLDLVENILLGKLGKETYVDKNGLEIKIPKFLMESPNGILFNPFNYYQYKDNENLIIVYNWLSHHFHSFPQFKFDYNENEYLCSYEFTYNNQLYKFEGIGYTKKEARNECIKKTFFTINEIENKENKQLLEKNVEKANKDNAVNVLQEMYQSNIISKPNYIFNTSFDDNGSPIWSCDLSFVYKNRRIIQFSINNAKNVSTSKKLLKKCIAYGVIKNIFEFIDLRSAINLEGVEYEFDGYKINASYNLIDLDYDIDSINNNIIINFININDNNEYKFVENDELESLTNIKLNNGDNIYEVIKNKIDKLFPNFDLKKCKYIKSDSAEDSEFSFSYYYQIDINSEELEIIKSFGYEINIK